MEYPSHSIAQAVEALSGLPGIGRKTALRLALHLLKTPEAEVERLATALVNLAQNTRRCQTCHNLCDGHLCNLCASPKRNRLQICVVSEPQDVIAIERTGQYNGLFQVLGGLINPLEGVSPSQLAIGPLVERVRMQPATEVILALPANMEGETTAFYVARQLAGTGAQVSNIARGVPVGSELEFTDELSIARSLQQRTAYQLPGPNGR